MLQANVSVRLLISKSDVEIKCNFHQTGISKYQTSGFQKPIMEGCRSMLRDLLKTDTFAGLPANLKLKLNLS